MSFRPGRVWPALIQSVQQQWALKTQRLKAVVVGIGVGQFKVEKESGLSLEEWPRMPGPPMKLQSLGWFNAYKPQIDVERSMLSSPRCHHDPPRLGIRRSQALGG